MDPSNSPAKHPRRARGRPRGWVDKTEQNTIKSLDRALNVFAYLSEEQGKPLTVLAEETGQSPATVYRILITLLGQGLVEFDPAEQVWHIGPRAFVIGSRFLRRTSLVDRARPVMRRLMEITGETANLGVEREGMVLFLSQVETHESIRAFFPPGTLSQMHASGIGKALLANMETTLQARLLRDMTLTRYTPHTITTVEGIIQDLANIRTAGYALDNEEKNLGMRCIAAPVFDYNREVVAGISVSGPVSRLSMENAADLAQHVMYAAAELTSAIGGTTSKATKQLY